MYRRERGRGGERDEDAYFREIVALNTPSRAAGSWRNPRTSVNPSTLYHGPETLDHEPLQPVSYDREMAPDRDQGPTPVITLHPSTFNPAIETLNPEPLQPDSHGRGLAEPATLTRPPPLRPKSESGLVTCCISLASLAITLNPSTLLNPEPCI